MTIFILAVFVLIACSAIWLTAELVATDDPAPQRPSGYTEFRWVE